MKLGPVAKTCVVVGVCLAGCVLFGQAGARPEYKPYDFQALPGRVMPSGMTMAMSYGGTTITFPVYQMSFSRRSELSVAQQKVLLVTKEAGDQTSAIISAFPLSESIDIAIVIPQFGQNHTFSGRAYFTDIQTKVVQRAGGGTAQTEQLVFVMDQGVTYSDRSGTSTR